MRNAWLDEIKIRDMVSYINTRIKAKYIATAETQVEDWVNFTLSLIEEKECSQRVRDALISQYEFHYELNDRNEHVKDIEFRKLPWFV